MSNEKGTYQVVVGFDFSDLGYKAIDQALSQAPLHADLVVHVLGVLDPGKGLGPFGEDGKVDFEAAEKAQAEIASTAAAQSRSQAALAGRRRIMSNHSTYAAASPGPSEGEIRGPGPGRTWNDGGPPSVRESGRRLAATM